jgi:hypothetical protein
VTELGGAVEAVVRACEEELWASSIEPVSRTPESVRSLLDAGEDVVAYEILCDNLYEDDIPVPRPLLLALSGAVSRAGVDPGRLAPLFR